MARTAEKVEGGKKGVRILVVAIHGKGDKRGLYIYSRSTGIELFNITHFLSPVISTLVFTPPFTRNYRNGQPGR